MIEPEDLKEGMLIWWTEPGRLIPWNCPGIITKVDKKKGLFSVKTFDDFKESDNLFIDGSSLKDGMRQATADEVSDYLELRKGELEEVALRAQNTANIEQQRFETYKQKALEALKEIR